MGEGLEASILCATTASEFGVLVLGFGFWVLGFGFWVLGLGFWVMGYGFWVLGFGFWVLGFGFWVLGFGFWGGVWGKGLSTVLIRGSGCARCFRLFSLLVCDSGFRI